MIEPPTASDTAVAESPPEETFPGRITAHLRCDICGATSTKLGIPFTKQQQLSLHKARTHFAMGPGGANSEHKRGKFQCPLCEKNPFKRYHSLTHHLRAVHNRSIREFPELIKTRKQKVVSKPKRPSLENDESSTRPTGAQIIINQRHARFCPVCRTDMDVVEAALHYGPPPTQ